VVALPWYVAHVDELRQQVDLYSTDRVSTYTPFLGELKKFSLRHLTYYPRSFLDTTVYLPLAACFAGGTLYSLVRFARARRQDDYTPELVAGLLVFGFGLLNVNQADWRFALAGFVYVALLGAGWIVTLPRPLAIVGAAGIAGLFVANTVMANFAVGKDVKFEAHGVVVRTVSPNGILVNKPHGVSRLQDALIAAKRDGIRGYWVFQPTESPPDFELSGLGLMADVAGLGFTNEPRLRGNEMGVLFRGTHPGDPPPCSWITERRIGTMAIYLAQGPVSAQKLQSVIYGGDPRGVHLICPR
jgi:hypothetical protein